MGLISQQYPNFRFGNGLRLQGQTQRGTISGLSGAMDSWSMLTWLDCTGTQVGVGTETAGATLWYNADASSAISVRLILTSGQIVVRLFSTIGSTSTTVNGDSILLATFLNRRHLVVVTRTPPTASGTGRLSISVDGKSLIGNIEVSSTAAGTWADPIGFGGSGTANGHNDTVFGESKLVGAALTDAQIARIWNGGRGSAYVDTALSAMPVLFQHKCDQIVSNQILDASGNGRHMALFGSPNIITFPASAPL